MLFVRRSAPFLGVSVMLAVAFVLLPGPLAGGDYADHGQLVSAVHQDFVGYWQAGRATLSPPLQHVVDYWFRYHVSKAVIAGLLLVVLVAAGVRLRQSLSGVALAATGTAVFAVGALAVVTVMANIQGMVAPFGSLFPMLLEPPATPPLTGALAEAGHQLSPGGRLTPVTRTMVDEYVRYHAALAVLAVALTIVVATVAIRSWRRFADRRQRATMPILWSLLTLAPIVLVIANVSSVLDPVPGLLGLVRGGW